MVQGSALTRLTTPEALNVSNATMIPRAKRGTKMKCSTQHCRQERCVSPVLRKRPRWSVWCATRAACRPIKSCFVVSLAKTSNLLFGGTADFEVAARVRKERPMTKSLRWPERSYPAPGVSPLVA
jgi:hypothetical protein